MNILVTGGASGLGAAIVELLAKDSSEHKVYFTYARSADAARRTEELLPNTQAIPCDFTSEESMAALLESIPFLQPDVLINNAWGRIHKEHFYKTDPAVFSTGFHNNVLPALRITQEAIKAFRKQKFGKIITILSSAIINKPPIGWSEYVAGKAYMHAMSNCWATEGIKFNITSNCVSPSFMQTDMTSDTDERIIEQMIENHPIKKLLTTKEVAEAVLYLTKSSQQVNGTNLVLNAGADIT
jgi:NAD(P)-dependent dehydrogenase (short-subunit alcohol dehydrogenase family)